MITESQALPHQPMVSTFLDLQKGPCHYFNRVNITSVFWPPFVTLVFFLPAAASAQLSRRKWRALSGLVGYPAFGKWNFSKRGRECSRPEAESIEGWTVWLADSVQSAVGLAERVLVMHFSR